LSAANLAILDTSVYIDNLRSERFKNDILALPYVIRLSAVVLAELSRGARSREMKKFVEDIRSNLLAVTPTENEWAVSGQLVNRIATARRFDIHKTREIHLDVLIALSARRIGAAVITCNRVDFTAIREFINFKLICW